MKRKLAILLCVMLIIPMIAACGGSGDTGGNAGSSAKDPYSGIEYAEDTEYKYLYSSEITTMNYLVTSIAQNHRSLANFVDTLIEFDKFGNVVPCLAESWETSEDGLTWTFKLREGVKWYNCDAEEVAEVTADDFVYGARLVANADFGADTPDLLISIVENGFELYNKVIDDYSELGVEAKDDYTLVYHLKHPCSYFLSLLAYNCYMPIYGEFYESLEVENPEPVINDDGTEGDPITNEFGTDRDKILYNGAYICSSWQPQEEYVWTKNENYWDKDEVYITKVIGKYNSQADSIAPEMYLRGEIDECTVTSSILDDWLSGENAEYVHTTLPDGFVMYMLLNFKPNLDDEEANEIYKAAVNNKNFRKSIYYGLDKEYSLSAYDPLKPDEITWNRMMPDGFASTEDGKDYNTFAENADEFDEDTYDEEKALEYKEKAMEELEAEGVKFPIEIPLYYNPSAPNQDQCCQLIEKQLENTLGTDYLKITTYAGPATNYISEVRSKGIWGLFEAGWGPDYADPATFFEPFSYNWSFGSQEYIEGEEYQTGYTYTEEDFAKGIIVEEDLIGKPQFVFNSLVEEARAETQDADKRFELFTKAEMYALEEVLFIPYRLRTSGYQASNMTVFDQQYTLTGLTSYRLKGRHMLVKSYSQEEFDEAKANWEKEKEEQAKD